MENNNMSLSLIVFIVFLTLKLSGVIDWSWWWVTLPLWWMFPLIIILVAFAAIVVMFETFVKRFNDED